MVSCLKEYASRAVTLCSPITLDDSFETLQGKVFCDSARVSFSVCFSAGALLLSISRFTKNDDTQAALTASTVAAVAVAVLCSAGLTFAACRKAARNQHEESAV